jgi:hypothetical protein
MELPKTHGDRGSVRGRVRGPPESRPTPGPAPGPPGRACAWTDPTFLEPGGGPARYPLDHRRRPPCAAGCWARSLSLPSPFSPEPPRPPRRVWSGRTRTPPGPGSCSTPTAAASSCAAPPGATRTWSRPQTGGPRVKFKIEIRSAGGSAWSAEKEGSAAAAGSGSDGSSRSGGGPRYTPVRSTPPGSVSAPRCADADPTPRAAPWGVLRRKHPSGQDPHDADVDRRRRIEARAIEAS